MVFPPNQKEGAVRLPHSQITQPAGVPAATRHQQRRPCTARRRRTACGGKQVPAGRCAKAQPRQRGRSADRSRASGKERGKSASGSAQKHRALRSEAGQSATLDPPAHLPGPPGHPSPCASDRHRQAETPQAARWSTPRRQACGIERGAGLPAGVEKHGQQSTTDVGSERQRIVQPTSTRFVYFDCCIYCDYRIYARQR